MSNKYSAILFLSPETYKMEEIEQSLGAIKTWIDDEMMGVIALPIDSVLYVFRQDKDLPLLISPLKDFTDDDTHSGVEDYYRMPKQCSTCAYSRIYNGDFVCPNIRADCVCKSFVRE
jgi:hypothetical protein